MPTLDNNTLALLNGTTGTSTAGTTSKAAAASGSEDRFLKLLVAQMQNQDPLNPMDNAQVTTQMAQISTVSGIDRLNGTVATLNSQFTQMQALQGAALVGRDVVVEGNRLVANDAGLPQGGFELTSAADSVRVEVLNSAGHVIDTIDLGAETAGRHGFEWTPPAGVDAATGAAFRVTARSGSATLATTPLMRDRVDAVSTAGDTLTLELRLSGQQPYSAIRAFN